jgi:transposase
MRYLIYMAERLVNVDRDTPMLLPVDLREWIADDDIAHFIVEVISSMNITTLATNRRGTGSAQYPPKTMLMLLVYCYATGIFGSRRIERATYQHLSVRFITGNTHPDHDTICKFRRENLEAIQQVFLHVLRVARESGILKVGSVSVDGTHIKANASKNKNIRYDRMKELEEQLELDIQKLLKQAEEADENDKDEGHHLPKHLQKREALLDKIKKAKEALEKQARELAEAEQADYQEKLAAYEARNGKGTPPKPPSQMPDEKQQVNLTDDDSRLMKKNRSSPCQQAYNAQAVVDADGSQLILAGYVTSNASDSHELDPAITSIDPQLGPVKEVLADTGYVNSEIFDQYAADPNKPELYVAVRTDPPRRYDYRPREVTEKPPPPIKGETLQKMHAKVTSSEGKKKYNKRKQTVEPVFGIIKNAIGFRQFLLRGLSKVNIEWHLLCLAYNMKRLSKLMRKNAA